MIENIKTFSEFLFLQAMLEIEIEENLIEKIENPNLIMDTKTSRMMRDFLNDENTEEKDVFSGSKKILKITLDSINNLLNKNKKITYNLCKNFLFETNNYYNLANKLFKLESLIANQLFESFFSIYFGYSELSNQEYIKQIKLFLEQFEQYNLQDNEYIQSIYLVFIRGLMNRNAITIDKELSKMLINQISSEGIKDSFIPSFFHQWTKDNN